VVTGLRHLYLGVMQVAIAQQYCFIDLIDENRILHVILGTLTVSEIMHR
jgi:hypothetical protein